MNKHCILFVVLLLALVSCKPQGLTKSGLDPMDFEAEYDGCPTGLFTLTNDAGMEVCITNFGGRIVSVMVPDKHDRFRDVVLGFDKVSDYFPENNASDFGAAIGRYANRINQGRINVDGVDYQLPQNNCGHCLHGGPEGWQYKVYIPLGCTRNILWLAMYSPDGDSGFPGEVQAFVTYTLTEDNCIDIQYEAVTTRTTVINLTNHSYFNLSGKPLKHSVCDDIMYVNASNMTPVDSTFMTTGEIVPVSEHPAFDFREAKLIGKDIDADDEQIRNGLGYDHNWVLDTGGDLSVPAVVVTCPESGIVLTEYTTEPGIQIYSGNFLDGSVVGKKGAAYPRRSGLCLESQKYPDTPNKPEWPSAVLRPGETYRSHTIFAFSVAE